MANFAEARARIATNLSTDVRAATITGIREVLTEANTDAIIERVIPRVKSALPAYLKWLPVGTVLDYLLPGTLEKVIVEILD